MEIKRKISIIIVTYNSQKLISDCISSVGNYLDVNSDLIDVFVVDNSAGENAAEMKKLVENHPLILNLKISYIQNHSNLGYGQGNNVGIAASEGNIICIMNPDVRFGQSILKDVIQQFEDPKLALLSYKQIGGFNHSFYLKPEFKNFFTGILMKLANKIDFFSSKYFYISGAFLFIDREKFKEIGLFDENIFLYFEEPDISKRFLDKNYKIKYDNSKRFYHLVGDRVSWSEKSFSNQMHALKYYLLKFNFNEKKVINNFLGEYKFKIFFAKILKDHIRLVKFRNEVRQIKEIFNF